MNGIRVALLTSILLLGGAVAGSELYGTDPGQTRIRRPPGEYVLPPRSVMHVSLDVLVNGEPVRLITHQGRLYLPVPRMGAEYEIRVNNHGSRRITAIVSVDGLSVINGKPASEQQPGYIVDPYRNVVIKGWRRDRNTVAAFTFEDRERSYAARMGHPENIGVIGLVAFEEQTPWPRPLLERSGGGAPAAKDARRTLGEAGTGWGRDLDSPIQLVLFARSTNKRTITIYYDTVEALRRAGVPVDGRYPIPFPGDPEYAPPPPLR
jgi:hypothetical protein